MTTSSEQKTTFFIACFVLVLTVALSLLWSHHKLMSQDEFYSFRTDSVPQAAQVVAIQRSYPISLDPPLYHLLSHLGMNLFGAGAFALRFPSFLGYLLMQVCLYLFVRNIAGPRAGIVAMAFPALTATFFYSAEGRPYGLLLGLYALALLCWQQATREGAEKGRTPALIGLAATIALTLNTHYFGVLLLLPICAAELVRTFQRKRLDLPVLLAIGVGMASIVAVFPFKDAVGAFRKHYYNSGSVGYHDITQSYRSLFLDYTRSSMRLQHLAMVVLVILAAVLIWGTLRQLRNRALQVAGAEWTLILVLAALPFFGYLLAKFVTHSIEVRYVLGAIVAISILIAIASSPLLRKTSNYAAIVTLLLLATVAINVAHIHAEKQRTADTLVSFVLPPQVKAALDASPDQLLFIQDMGTFQVASYYEPDPAVRSRMALVYSQAQEIEWNHHDTMALTALHMQRFTRFPIVSYEELKAKPGDHLFVLFHGGWDWTDQAFAQDRAQTRSLGSALGGDAAAVRF